MTKAAVIYARISVASEESVSVERQLASARKYAEARGWVVVGEFVDDGVSATSNKPEKRQGWRNLLGCDQGFDAVVIWKVDRLARRVIDFLHADETLQERGAAIVCVEQSIDMTTGEGRAFAQMLAVFGELEAATLSSRMTAARVHLLHAGRVPAGPAPYGWRIVPNPDGPGFVLAHDPERIGWVRGMATRALRGDSVRSIAKWLDSENAPLPRVAQSLRNDPPIWKASTVRRLLGNPILGGMIVHNPGIGRRGRAQNVLRRPDGSAVVRTELAILNLEDYGRLTAILDAKSAAYRASRELRSDTRSIAAGIARCGVCDRAEPLNPGVIAGRPRLQCPKCRLSVASDNLAKYLERRLLSERGALVMRLPFGDVSTSSAARRLERVERALRTSALALTEDNADVAFIAREVASLKLSRTRARHALALATGTGPQQSEARLTVESVWRRCASDDQRRDVLRGQIASLTIYNGRARRSVDADRIDLRWQAECDLIVPTSVAFNDEQPEPQPDEWVSFRTAAELLDWDMTAVRRAVRGGGITQRTVTNRTHPSLLRASVLQLIALGPAERG